MTEAMLFLQNSIILSYDPRPKAGGFSFNGGYRINSAQMG